MHTPCDYLTLCARCVSVRLLNAPHTFQSLLDYLTGIQINLASYYTTKAEYKNASVAANQLVEIAVKGISLRSVMAFSTLV